MRYAILVRDKDYMIIQFSEGSDPLYGYGSWNLHSTWDSQFDADQAIDYIQIVVRVVAIG